MSDYSYLSNADPIVIESMYQQFLTDPDSVDVSWQYFFQGFEFSNLDFSPKNKKYLKEVVTNKYSDGRKKWRIEQVEVLVLWLIP